MEFTKRQVEIIHAAMQLMDQGGIQNLTTKNLAAYMDFTEPSLYRHFKNKTDLLNSTLIYYQGILKQGMEINENMSGIDQIKALIRFQFEKFISNPSIILVIFSETSFQNESALQETIKRIMHQKEQRIVKIIKAGQDDGSIRNDLNSQTLAQIIMGAMRFTALRWKLSGFASDLNEEARLLQESIFKMIKSNTRK